MLRAISLSVLHAAHRDQCVRRDDARKFLDAGVEELRRRRLVKIADAQHFPRVPTGWSRRVLLPQCMSPKVAQMRSAAMSAIWSLSGEKRTSRTSRFCRCGGHTRRAAARGGGARQRSLASPPRFRAVDVSSTSSPHTIRGRCYCVRNLYATIRATMLAKISSAGFALAGLVDCSAQKITAAAPMFAEVLRKDPERARPGDTGRTCLSRRQGDRIKVGASEPGTFETSQRTLRMSADRGRWE